MILFITKKEEKIKPILKPLQKLNSMEIHIKFYFLLTVMIVTPHSKKRQILWLQNILQDFQIFLLLKEE